MQIWGTNCNASEKKKKKDAQRINRTKHFQKHQIWQLRVCVHHPPFQTGLSPHNSFLRQLIDKLSEAYSFH